MSDSPKYCSARLRAAQERKLREKRERQAAKELARRKAEEERRGSTRLEQGRKAAKKEFAEIQTDLAALLKTDTARFIQTDQLDALRTRLRELEVVINETILEDRVRATMADLQSIRESFRVLNTQANAAKLCMALAAEEAELTKLEHQVTALDHARSEKFDRIGFQELVGLLGNARSNLQRQDLPQVRKDTAEAQKRLIKHRDEVAKQCAAWQAAKDRAEIALATASDRIGGLRADEVLVRWANRELTSVEERLDRLTKMIQEERFEQVCIESVALLKAGDGIVAHAQDVQLKEERRQYVVEGVLGVMHEMGFVVQQGSPALEHPEVPSSATMIHAVRIGGGAIAVSVPQDGEIMYDVGGFPMRTETGGDGRTIRTCDEAEQQILRMHEAIKEEFGIEMGELLWEGKDPDRIRKAAERLPESTAEERARGE